MSYVQIEIGGKLRGWKVNQMTLEIWSKKTNLESETVSSNYAAVYAGLISNCYVKNEEPDFTFEDVCDWVDSLTDPKIMELIKKTFEGSQVYIATLERMENVLKASKKDTSDKKKVKMK